MNTKKPKPEDFRIGEPITDEERQDALRRWADFAVEGYRKKAFDDAIKQWRYDMVMDGR